MSSTAAPLTTDPKCVSTCTARIHSSSSTFYAQNPAFDIVQQQSVKVYLHMYNGNVQQNPQCVAFCVTKNLPISPRFSPTIFYRDANSVLLSTSSYRSRLYAQNPVFEIAHQESVKVCSTHVVVKNSL